MKPSQQFDVLLWNEKDGRYDELNYQMAVYLVSAAEVLEMPTLFNDDVSPSYILFINRTEALHHFHRWLEKAKDGTTRCNALISLINLFENEFNRPYVMFINDKKVWDSHESIESEG